jgi:hypothetical protein
MCNITHGLRIFAILVSTLCFGLVAQGQAPVLRAIPKVGEYLVQARGLFRIEAKLVGAREIPEALSLTTWRPASSGMVLIERTTKEGSRSVWDLSTSSSHFDIKRAGTSNQFEISSRLADEDATYRLIVRPDAEFVSGEGKPIRRSNDVLREKDLLELQSLASIIPKPYDLNASIMTLQEHQRNVDYRKTMSSLKDNANNGIPKDTELQLKWEGARILKGEDSIAKGPTPRAPYAFLRDAVLLSMAADSTPEKPIVEIFVRGSQPKRIENPKDGLAELVRPYRSVFCREGVLRCAEAREALRMTRATVWTIRDRSLQFPAFGLGMPTRNFDMAVMAPETEEQAKTMFGSYHTGWDAFKPLIKSKQIKLLRTQEDLQNFVRDSREKGRRPIVFLHSQRGKVPLPGGGDCSLWDALGGDEIVLTCDSADYAPVDGERLLTVRVLRWRILAAIARDLTTVSQKMLSGVDIMVRVEIVNDAEEMVLVKQMGNGIQMVTKLGVIGATTYVLGSSASATTRSAEP